MRLFSLSKTKAKAGIFTFKTGFEELFSFPRLPRQFPRAGLRRAEQGEGA
jgi:hypothetical protein